MKTIYFPGNSLVEEDKIISKIIPRLKKSLTDFRFIQFDPAEFDNFPQNLIILDTATGIKKTTVFNNLSHFERSKRVTVHDFDLPIFLGLSLKLKKIRKIKIIAVPVKISPEKAEAEISAIINGI